MKLNIDQLAELPAEELAERFDAAADRVEERIARAQNASRDLTEREAKLCRADREELETLQAARKLREHRDHMTRTVAEAIDAHHGKQVFSLMPSPHTISVIDQARRDGGSVSLVETRAALTTSDMGTATGYAAGVLAPPRNLWQASAIPTTEPAVGYSGVVPTITLPAGATLAAEGSAHTEFDAVTPDSVTLGRAGAWSDLSSEAGISTSTQELSAAHARVIARHLDLAVVSKIEGSDAGVYRGRGVVDRRRRGRHRPCRTVDCRDSGRRGRSCGECDVHRRERHRHRQLRGAIRRGTPVRHQRGHPRPGDRVRAVRIPRIRHPPRQRSRGRPHHRRAAIRSMAHVWNRPSVDRRRRHRGRRRQLTATAQERHPSPTKGRVPLPILSA